MVFLCGKNVGANHKIGGTAFLVTLQGEGTVHAYLVTAQHSLELARKNYEELYLRVNMKDAWYSKEGRSVNYIKVPFDWTRSDDPAVDVAVLPAPSILALAYQVAVIPEEMFLTDAISEEYQLSVGDEVLITGLFTKRAGRERNIPIVRGGIVAAGPEEPLPDVGRTGLSYRAYLLEVRSIGGISGSPVFVFLGYDRDKDGQINQQARVFLLGMIRAHWDYRPGESVEAVDDERKDKEPLNSGIAIAIPVQEIVAVLNKEELVKQRRERERQIAEKNAPTLD